jgi:integrase
VAFIWWPREDQLSAKGYESIAHVPVLFGSDWSYLRETNRYLRERALLEWMPKDCPEPETIWLGNPRYPTTRTLENIAGQLCNFLEWAEWRDFDWKTLDYTQGIVNGYQADMLSGRWSARAQMLGAGTVNGRVGEACSFLRWAATQMLRGPFTVISGQRSLGVDSGKSSVGHFPQDILVRAGAVRADPKSLWLPTEEQVIQWIRDVCILRGPTKGLMCALILESGIRLQEAVQWRVDTLPLDKNQWLCIGDKVQVTLSFGTKGTKRYPGSLEGPRRIISIPLSLAKKLDDYRSLRRVVLQGKWIQSAKTKEEYQSRRQNAQPARLFFSDFTGRPFSDQALYDGWKNVPSLPYKQWSPHLGRHYWACMELLKSQRQKVASIGRQLDQFPDDWITSQAMTDIQLIIRPQLGHVSVETTQRYLQWLHGAVSLTKYTLDYHDILDCLDG